MPLAVAACAAAVALPGATGHALYGDEVPRPGPRGVGTMLAQLLAADSARLVGEPLDGLLFTCVGVPEYKSK
jgi:hypothetical protein